MKFERKTIWILLPLFFPLCANALGVKDIKVFSALNQPLKARIALVSIKDLDPQDIRVRLAAPEKFEKAGIGRPYFLTRLKFETIVKADGTGHIQVISRDIVREPYLDFLLEISWRGGSLIKEYAILLDPVTMRQATVTPIKKRTPKQKSPTPPAEKKQTYGPVKKAETLWVIAQRTRPDRSIPIKQMIMAIHRDNPNAFVRGNINLLKQGATLNIPGVRAINRLSPGSAKRLYQEQEQAWRDQQTTTTVIQKYAPEPKEKTPDIAKEALPTKTIKPDTEITAAPVMEPPEHMVTPEADTSTEMQPATETDEAVEDAKLKVVATPEGQLEEIQQTLDSKVYPQGEVEQLHESIADTEQDITALGAINQDLIKLRTALQAKIALVQQELVKTNQAIAIVSGKMDSNERAEPKTDLTATPAPTPEQEQEQEPVSIPALIEPETTLNDTAEAEITTERSGQVSPSVISQISRPEIKESAGTQINTDLAEIARIKKLEEEIEALKSQGQMLQVFKYLVMVLAIAFLVALAMVIINNRRNRPVAKRHPQKPYLGRSKQSSYSTDIPTNPAIRARESEDTALEVRQEMPFDATHSDAEEVISQNEHPTMLSSHFDAPASDKPEPHPDEQDDDIPTPNTILFESSQNEDDQDLDSIITTVDVYLAYRRLTEAESILHNSIEQHPELPELKAKLLEIYAFKKDADLFTRYLERYQEELTTKAPKLWKNILSLAVQLIPDHAYVADMHSSQTDEQPVADSDTSPNANQIDLETDKLVDELIIGDIQRPEDELFRIDQDDQDTFDIDLDMDELNKSK